MTAIPGFRFQSKITRPPLELWQGLTQFTTPDICDALQGLFSLSTTLKNQLHTSAIAGPALTVKLPAYDNLMLHKALDFVEAGDVVVVQAGGAQAATAVCGELLANKLYHRGAVAVIIDGYIRDIEGIKSLKLPIWARGTTTLGPRKQGPGEINGPIACGGQVIQPGDLILADEMGLVVIPQADIAYVLTRLNASQDTQRHYHEQVRAGHFDNSWVDRYLQEQNCQNSPAQS